MFLIFKAFGFLSLKHNIFILGLLLKIKRGGIIFKKAQIWSADLIIAVIIFLVILGIFYGVMANHSASPGQDLEQQSDYVASQLDKEKSSNPYAVIEKNELDQRSLNMLYNASYDELKKYFNIKGDFCIYIEDQEGYLMVWRNASGANKTGVGYDIINISGTPCGNYSS